MKIQEAINELTALHKEHGDIDLYISVETAPFINAGLLGNGPIGALTSTPSTIAYEPQDGTGVGAAVIIRDWPY